MPEGSGGDVVELVAAELRRVAARLEADELQLTEPVRYTHIGVRDAEVPPEVEITYLTRRGFERTVEVRS